jgi:hypothetical protein
MNMIDGNILARPLLINGPLLYDGQSTHANLRYLKKI